MFSKNRANIKHIFFHVFIIVFHTYSNENISQYCNRLIPKYLVKKYSQEIFMLLNSAKLCLK